MRVLLWLYAVTGTLYFVLHANGSEVVQRYAVGPLWLLMVAAPVLLAILVMLPVLGRR